MLSRPTTGAARFSIDPSARKSSVSARTTLAAAACLVLDPTALVPLANLGPAPHGFRFDNADGSFGGAYFNISSVTLVPEPASLALVALGGLLAAAAGRRRVS